MMLTPFHASLLNPPIGPYIVVELRRPMLRMSDIKRAVATYYGLPTRVMESDRRHGREARTRQIAMYLCRQLTPRSLPDIGRSFGGRDHTTVLHAVRKIQTLREQDGDLDEDLRILKREILA